jgi:hypothetical protein
MRGAVLVPHRVKLPSHDRFHILAAGYLEAQRIATLRAGRTEVKIGVRVHFMRLCCLCSFIVNVQRKAT